MDIGLYFGSFNPIHIGHLIIANHILNNTELKKVWFVVSPQNPFKESAQLLNEYDRLHLVRTAVEGDNRLRVSDIEFTLPKPSFTAATLSYLTEKNNEDRFHIIMGSDSFQNLGKWKNSNFITTNYPILVYQRPGYEILIQPNNAVTLLQAPLLQISASHIRELIKNSQSIKYLVPKNVEEEIEKSGFYKRSYKK